MTLYPPPADSSFDIGEGLTYADPGIMETGHVPVTAYTSDARFELERELFGKVWLCMGREEQLAGPGDWIVRSIECRSASALIVRGKDMQVRAFHNICSHRGMKLVWDDKGRGGKFACPYHAWIYDSAGDLINIPDEGCFAHVDKKESGLTPIHCDVWEGFVFINLDPAPAQTLREFLGPLAERLAEAPFAQFTHTLALSQPVMGNWKLGIEAASEGYHVQALHTQSVGQMISTRDNPHVNFLAWEPLGPHRNATIPCNPEYRLPERRMVQRFASANGQQMMVEGGAEGNASGDFLGHPGINRINSQVFGNEQFNLFPNFSIHISVNGYWTTSYWPISKGRANWLTTYYYKPPKSCREEFSLQVAGALQRDIFAEDNSCFQKQQSMLESGVKRFVQLGESEILLRHLHAVVEGIDRNREGGAPDYAIAAE
jgi:phenylpropionate dioxygenase-like ring-hydroxylating dioxygenase large terminal subunit